jgi:hypothetical protein
MPLRSYTSSFNLGHKQLEHLFEDDVLVQEKIDGSQFSFGRSIDDGQLFCRSKKVNLDIDAPEGMFKEAVEYVRSIYHRLPGGWTFRGEYLKSPRHNTLAYGRIPRNHIMLFDIDCGMEDYVTHEQLEHIAGTLDLEAVPVMYYGRVTDIAQVHAFMARESALGGSIEGVVIKNYSKYNAEKKLLLGKHVSEAFKETNDKNWKAQKVGQRDIVEALTERYATEARWQKAVQHLNEAGQLENSPRDIGPLIKEIQNDVLQDSVEEIKQALFDWALPKLQRGLTKDFPFWYKEQLLVRQFDDTHTENDAVS